MDLPVGLGAGLAQGMQEELPVLVTAKDVLAMIVSIHHMIDGPFVLNSEFPRHHERVWSSPEKWSILRTDPLYGLLTGVTSRPGFRRGQVPRTEFRQQNAFHLAASLSRFSEGSERDKQGRG